MKYPIVYFVRPRTIVNFAATFRDVAEAGISHVVLADHMGDVNLLEHTDVVRAKRCLAELNLVSPAIHGLLCGHFDLNEADASKRPEMLQSHLRLLEHAAEMGCRTYVVHPGPVSEGEDRQESWDRVRETLDHLAPRASELGVIIALENANPGNLGDNAGKLRAFVEDYACPSVKICFDAGHAHRAEEALTVLRALSPLVVTCHLHDNDKSADQHLLPGQGTIPWGSLVALLAECPMLMHIETEPFNPDKWDHTRVYRRYLEILGRHVWYACK